MERKTGKGRRKIEMKLVESKDARYVTFSKRKLSLFKKVDQLAILTGADVGVLLSSPSGKSYSHGSTSIEKIIDKFQEWKLDNPQVDDQADMKKLDVFKAFDDIREEIQALDEKGKGRKMRHHVLHPDSEIPLHKHRLERLVAIKLRLEKIRKEAKNNDFTNQFKFDLNVVPELDEGESSGTHS